MKKFGGTVLFLDRNDINTDEIIPAKYLTEISKEALAPHLLEDFQCNNFNYSRDICQKNVIVTRENFGCGSSREHAVWALEVNSITMVIGQSFARIFKQNMFNCGLIALTFSKEIIDSMFKLQKSECTITFSFESLTITCTTEKESMAFPCNLTSYETALVEAGGWVEYADSRYT